MSACTWLDKTPQTQDSLFSVKIRFIIDIKNAAITDIQTSKLLVTILA